MINAFNSYYIPSTDIDIDAQAFLTAAGISQLGSIPIALSYLTRSLKSENLWNKFDAIYPIVGGTASAHKFNLKDPQDTDGSYRIAFSGTVTHSTNGMAGNGATGFGDTKWNPFSRTAGVSGHVSAYVHTAGSSGFDIGAAGLSGVVGIDSGTGGVGSGWFHSGASNTFGLSSLGHHLVTRTSTNTLVYKNGSLGQDAARTTDAPNFNVFILARNGSGSADSFSDASKVIAFASMGADTFNATEVSTYYNIVQQFQRYLGRAV